MIRLMEDCDVRDLFKKGHPEALRRYWVFLAYGSPCYFVTNEAGELLDDEDQYIESFQYPGQNFIDVGRFDLAFPFFQMDEWTTVTGFVSSPEQAPEIAHFVVEHEMTPERVTSKFPKAELLEFLWGDGWWEVFGDIDVAMDLIKPDLVWVDTESSIYLNKKHDKKSYCEARSELEKRIEKKYRKVEHDGTTPLGE